MLNHQCPRIRCRIREPAANLLSICLLGCSSRDLQSCGCFSCLYVFGCKITKNPAYSDTFCKLSYGLIAFSLFKGFDISFLLYLFISFGIRPVAGHLVMSLCIDRKGNEKANHFQRKNKKKQKNRICCDCKSCFVWGDGLYLLHNLSC